MKIVSFAVNLPTKKQITKIEYPELDEMLSSGYELIDVLPGWGAGNQYVVTFQLDKAESVKASKRR